MKPPGSRKGPAAKPGPSQTATPTQDTLPLEGLPETDRSVNPFYVGDAIRAISTLVETGAIVTADDLHRLGIGRPEKSNTIGSIFRDLHRLGVIERVGYCGSTRSGRNGSAVGVWRKGGNR